MRSPTICTLVADVDRSAVYGCCERRQTDILLKFFIPLDGGLEIASVAGPCLVPVRIVCHSTTLRRETGQFHLKSNVTGNTPDSYFATRQASLAL